MTDSDTQNPTSAADLEPGIQTTRLPAAKRPYAAPRVVHLVTNPHTAGKSSASPNEFTLTYTNGGPS